MSLEQCIPQRTMWNFIGREIAEKGHLRFALWKQCWKWNGTVPWNSVMDKVSSFRLRLMNHLCQLESRYCFISSKVKILTGEVGTRNISIVLQ